MNKKNQRGRQMMNLLIRSERIDFAVAVFIHLIPLAGGLHPPHHRVQPFPECNPLQS